MSAELGAVVAFAAGALLAGLVVGWIVAQRGRLAVRLARAEEAAARATLEERLAAERAAGEERAAALEEARERLGEAFKALAGDALASNAKSFLDLARESLATLQAEAKGELAQRQLGFEALVAPLRTSLAQVDAQMRDLERARQQAYGAIAEQLRGMAQAQESLQRETGNLVKALRAPQTRGQWGELQLRRAVELAGMVEHCDFDEQVTLWKGDESLRPDLVVHLPGGKEVVVDAKAPLAAYLDGLASDDDASRAARLADHARQVRAHVRRLAQKSYWDAFATAPDFVVLFLPGEHFLSAALAVESRLFEEAFEQRVVLATPTTLIALLKSVYYGWQQEAIAGNARAISDAARELHERLRIFADHLSKVGKGLGTALGAYNQAVGSFESRVLVQGRRIEELGAVSGDRLAAPDAVAQAPRLVALAEETE